ncbi:MAG: NADH-quinone oxidoreductase subunit E, partial [Trueperella pyogenes]|nr:NADH-quinone oxidoreductase subunit E [Trueperella pyogenes]
HEHEGPSAGEASTLGLRIAEERGWSAPADVPAEEGKEKDGE